MGHDPDSLYLTAMGEDPPPPPPAVVPLPSLSLRFLRLSKPPATAAASSLPFELDESDVVWSPTDLSPRSPISDDPVLPPSPPRSAPPNPARRAFVPMKSGLSAALAEEGQAPVLRWRRAAALVPARPDQDETGLFGKSMPVNVPAWPRRRGARGGDAAAEEEEREEAEEEEMVPPHVMVARSHVTTFSVFEGAGRTLKGRDLRRVRNAVMRQTGFID